MDEFFYLPYEELADLSSGESLSAVTDKRLAMHQWTAAMPAVYNPIMREDRKSSPAETHSQRRKHEPDESVEHA